MGEWFRLFYNWDRDKYWDNNGFVDVFFCNDSDFYGVIS